MISRPLSGGFADACTRSTWPASIPNRERLAVSPTRKRIIILAGPNGAGKTTFAREFLPEEAECPSFVNADLIATGLSPFNPEVVAMRAVRLMVELIDEHVARGDIPCEPALFGIAVCGGCIAARSRASSAGRLLRS